jgi:TolA-binding protein
MYIRAGHTTTRLLAGVLAAATLASAPIPAAAQDSVAEARLRKIEAEVRALQRKVFPGGDGRFFEPQISPTDPASTTTTTPNPATTTAVTDILARLDAIELQLQRLTAVSEENGNAMSEMQARISALETSAAQALAANPVQPATGNNSGATTGAAGAAAGNTATTAQPSPERLAAVRAIAKPQTDDPGDDDYSYGYRLWSAGFFPEARQVLADFVAKYPSHYRVSYGRNLLGRAFLDDGLLDDAAKWFIENYQKDKTAARAPDSLLYLAETMIAMKDTRRACIALGEFSVKYPAEASGRLAEQFAANRRKVTCTS